MATIINREQLTLVSAHLCNGGIVAYRTDTLYGLGVNPLNPEAVRRLRELKGGDTNKPTLILVSCFDEAVKYTARRTSIFESLLKSPHSLTIVERCAASVPHELTAGTGTIGIRLPDDIQVCEFVRACGGSLTATSANPANLPPALTPQRVLDYFPNADLLIVDDGIAPNTLPSTILDISESQPRLIREGTLKREAVNNLLRQHGISLQN